MSCMRVAIYLLLAGVIQAAEYRPPEPEPDVQAMLVDWRDAERNRTVPAKIYFPRDGKGALPIIIFSHGLGGSREGYEFLGRHWAGVGYVAVHLQHIGSDDGVWKTARGLQKILALKKATADVRNSINRPKDVSFAIDELTRMNVSHKVLKGRLDLRRIGVGGHSYGGYTALAIAGQNYTRGKTGDGRDNRVLAAIQMSAPVPSERIRGYAYDTISIPMFHMTGTKDESPINSTTAAERRIPFDRTKGEACFLNFKDGDHAIFSGRKRLLRTAQQQDAIFHRHICRSSTAFWDGYLKGDKSARKWLFGGGFKQELGGAGVFETRAR